MAPGHRAELGQSVPFDGLPADSLAWLERSVIRRELDVGALVIVADAEPVSPPIQVVLSGRVRLVEPERQMTVRHLGPGEVFGHFALFRRLPLPYRAEVSEPGVVVEIPNAVILALCERHPFVEAWLRADLRRFERELGAFDAVAGSRFLFGQRLGELEHAAAPLCDGSLSIRDAARLMSARDSDYVLVTEDGRPAGILSDADLRDKVVARGASVEAPVRDVMNAELLTIRARASVFDGMMAMEQRGWRHLVLLDEGGALQGVLSDSDLARALVSSPAALRRRLGQARTGTELGELRDAADRMIVLLYRRGVRADDLLKINTRFNDALTARVLEIVRGGLREPPPGLRWCWLSLGSEGRSEMGLRTDQDNAIVHASPDRASADAWLAELATAANALLDAAGIALCDGGIMAREPEMRQDLAGWRASVKRWMSDPDDVRLLWIGALSDCRAVHGDGALCGELKGMLRQSLEGRHDFLRILAREALVPALPLRRFPSLRLKAGGGGPDPSLNVKRQGTHLIVNAARLFCLEAGHLEPTATMDRLARLGDDDSRLGAVAREAAVAYRVLSDLRLSWHVEQADQGDALSDLMPLSRFGDMRKRLLVSAYQTVEDVRLRIRDQFGLEG